MGYYSGWAPYVPVAKRKELAAKKVKAAQKKGFQFNPITIEGRVIAKTFWGKAWCENLESYSDYENRLPRGRTYVRNGSVIDLQVTKGKVDAKVMGSSLYNVTIQVKPMPQHKWALLSQACSGKIDSLIELLQGKFSKAVMTILIAKEAELFPSHHEISMYCTCPDHADMCKHIAAVLYGIGAAIDTQPEWLFSLRHVDHLELLASATAAKILTTTEPSDHAIEESDLSALFGIEMEPANLSSGLLSSESKGICNEIFPTFSKTHNQQTKEGCAKTLDSKEVKSKIQVTKVKKPAKRKMRKRS